MSKAKTAGQKADEAIAARGDDRWPLTEEGFAQWSALADSALAAAGWRFAEDHELEAASVVVLDSIHGRDAVHVVRVTP